MIKKAIVALLACLLLVGCSSPKYEKGAWDEMTYHSDFFNFSISFDADTYHQYDIAEMAKALGRTVKELTEDESIAEMYEFMVSTEEDTPLFQFHAEKYKFTTMMTFEDFINEFVKELREQESVDYTVGGVQDVDLNGVAAKYIPMQIEGGFFALHQDIYMFKSGSYVGTLMITYTDGYEQAVKDVIATIAPIQ